MCARNRPASLHLCIEGHPAAASSCMQVPCCLTGCAFVQSARILTAGLCTESQGTAAFCVLPDLAGLDAIVRSEDISSAGPADPRDRVKVGDVIKGR